MCIIISLPPLTLSEVAPDTDDPVYTCELSPVLEDLIIQNRPHGLGEKKNKFTSSLSSYEYLDAQTDAKYFIVDSNVWF